jgi:Rha family phage regulatory protein
MTKGVSMENAVQLVEQHDGRAVTTSMKVAEVFGKQHKHVLDAIRRLMEDQDVSARLIFRQCYKINELANGKSEPYFEMDRDGFTLLSMGFTGKKALQFKLSYIDAFNKAEAIILGKIPAPTTRPELEAADIFKTYNELGKLIGFDENMAAFSANHATAKIINVNVLELMGVTRLIAPAQMADLTPSQLGEQLNPPRTAAAVNEMLVQLGYQVRTRVAQCPYQATEKGAVFSRLHDTPRQHTAGTVQQLRWYATVLDQQDIRWATGMLDKAA